MDELRVHAYDELGPAELGQLLRQQGIALVAAAPGDVEGKEVRALVSQLGTAEEHDRLGQVVWHIRYDSSAASGATASRTMAPLPLHTDGAFEEPPPRYLAQYVVREDRFGGGETLLVGVAAILRRLSPETVETLRSTVFRFRAPAEYVKGVPYRDAPILFGDGLMSYRRVIIDESLCRPAKSALDELDAAIAAIEPIRLRLHSGTILLLDNARFLHARSEVRDPERHLLRMRFSCPEPTYA